MDTTNPSPSKTIDASVTFVDRENSPKMYTEEKESPGVNSDEEQLVIEAPDVLSKQRIILLNLAWFGLSLMFLLLSVEVVPAQIQSLVGSAAKGRWLGGMVAFGAAMTFFASPLIGMKSDRSTFAVGRRRPVMILGAIALCIGLTGMAMSSPDVSMSQLARVSQESNDTRKCNVDIVAMRCQPYRNSSYRHPVDGHIEGAPDTGSIFNPQKPKDGEKVIRVEEETYGSLSLYIIFYLMVTTSFAAITVPYNALIADKSHPTQRDVRVTVHRQRYHLYLAPLGRLEHYMNTEMSICHASTVVKDKGLNSGVMAAMILSGNVCGAAVGTSFTQIGVIGVYSISIAAVILTLVATVVTTTEDPGKEVLEPFGCSTIFCGFWEPLKEHDFRWVFITRFLMQQGVSTVTGFLEYWLHDMVYLPNCWTAATCVAIMLLPMLFAAAVSSICFGIISDRTGRRKPFVVCAAGAMCLCISALIALSGKSAFYMACGVAFIFGVGFGSFQSVDFALVMDVLPHDKDKAKDIAVWQQALLLPNALATPVGGVILDYFQSVDCELGLGYIILFVVTAVYFCASGVFVFKIMRAQ